MTGLQELLQELEAKGVRLWSEGEQLRCRAPQGVLTPALVKELQERKPEILRFLQRAASRPTLREPGAPAADSALRRPATAAEAPLSFAQRRLWFLDQLGSGAAYNMPGQVELRGRLDVRALQQALQEIVRRHESLRTTFHARGEQVCQRISESAVLALPVVSLAHLQGPEQQLEAAQRAHLERSRPFDLERDLLLRVTLLRLGPAEHRLLFTMHHIASDAWSLNIFARELSTLYAAFSRGEPAPLPPLPAQYADYARWQHRQELGVHLTYWRQQLRKPLPVLELPFDFPPPPVADSRGGRCKSRLDPELTAALRGLARSRECTTFMVLLAAFGLLLHRYSGQDDLIIGAPSVGRSLPETEGLIGLFINTLALRLSFTGVTRFGQLLQRVREVTLDAMAHQEAPFDKIVEVINPDRLPGRDPVFEVMLNFVNVAQSLPPLSELEMTLAESAEVDALRPLTVYVYEAESTIELELVYQRALFAEPRMACLLEQLVWLLAQVVPRPEQPLHELSLVTPRLQAVLPELSAPLAAPLQEPITRLLGDWARRAPAQPALEWQGRCYTYAELWARSEQVAWQLLARGLQPGDVVAVRAGRSFGAVVSLCGVLLAGGVILPVAQELPARRQQAMLAVGGARVVLTVTGTAQKDAPALADDDSRCLRLTVDADQGQLAGSDPPPTALPAVRGEDPAYIMFTSGTTGQPKGILGSHRGLAHFLSWQRATFAVGPADRCAQYIALSFDVMLRDIFLALTSGATLCLPAPELELDGSGFLAWLARERITLLHPVPSLAQGWAQHAATDYRCTSLRYSFFAGEPLTDTLVKRWRQLFPAAQIANFYGPTETTMAKCWYKVPPEPDPGIQPVGRPLPQTQALILDAHEQLCGVGEPGQIVLRTPFRTLGYLNPEQGERRFVPNPRRRDPEDLLYYTGDRGRYRPDGALEILGRVDDELKVRGVRVRPAEIMALLDQHPAVAASAVIAGEPDQAGSKTLLAYAVLKPECAAQTRPRELRHYLSQHLPAALLPSAVVLVDRIPTTANGKLDRRALPPPPAPDSIAPFAVPRNDLERKMVQLWQELLGSHAIGIQDNFFELGGHSLIAVHLMARIAQQFGQKLPLAVLFACPTVETLVAHLRAEPTTSGWSALVAIQPKGDRRPLFCVPGLGGQVLYLHQLARLLGPAQPLYGLQAIGLDGVTPPHSSVEQMAAEYIRALKKVQAAGPYQLVGHSFGGQVVFEMGLQLRRSGDAVAAVVLLDSGPPTGTLGSAAPAYDEASVLGEMATLLAFMAGRQLELPPREEREKREERLRPLSSEQRLAEFRQLMEGAGLLPVNTDPQQIRGWLEVFKSNYKMAYLPQVTHPLPVHYFYAQEQSAEHREARLAAWRQFTPLATSAVPGSHLTMLAEPHISVLAQRLTELAAAAPRV